MFLMHEYSAKGDKSFWWPYIQVMNESDLASDWKDEEIAEMRDYALKKSAKTYREEIEEEWKQIKKILALYPEAYPDQSEQLFQRMYNFACTRCFGWTLPSTMMVPMADFLNHAATDTQYEIYQRDLHQVKASVDSQGYATVKRFTLDYKLLYAENELASFPEDVQKQVEGQVESADKIFIPRA